MIEKKILRGKCIITISMALLLVSLGLKTQALVNGSSNEIIYETVDIKYMAQAQVATKHSSKTIINTLINGNENKGTLSEVSIPKVDSLDQPTVQTEVKEQQQSQPVQQQQPAQVWYLPTEVGYVTQYQHGGHAAFDISSYRGSAETIYPVANGVISSIFTDNAGALVLTVTHDINGRKYTSLYAHMSSYAPGIYVGQQVSVYTPLGQMGTTGYSTGIHLHLVVTDCGLYEGECSTIGALYGYSNARAQQGYQGIGELMYVPGSWSSR